MVAKEETKPWQSLQRETVHADLRHSGGLNNVAHSLMTAEASPLQPWFSSLSQVSVINDTEGSLLVVFIKK